MMGLPVYFADIFARQIRGQAEARGYTFTAIYSTGTAVDWDFPRSGEEALSRMRSRAKDGQQVVVFRRDAYGVWRMWANANLPRREGAAA